MDRAGLHVYLLRQKLMKRPNEVWIEIEIVVGHLKRKDQKWLARALVMKLLGMLKRDQAVLLPMDDEGRAFDEGHQFQIIKMLRYKFAQ